MSKKRTAILEMATALFTRFGSKRVTVEEICRESGVSKMTFYKHFPNKVALVKAIHDELTERAFAKYDEISALKIPFPKKIDLMGQWKKEFYEGLNAKFFRELIDIEHSMMEFKERYLGNIRLAQEQGEIRPDLDLEFIWLVMEKLGELFKGDEWKNVFSNVGELQAQLRTLVWKGLLARPEGAAQGGENQ